MKDPHLKKFNVRVYGILTDKQKILLIKEKFQGKTLTKFPGGGMKLGESTIDCLKREFFEELSLSITIENHFYTTDFFQISKFNKEEQLLSIYYKVKALNIKKMTKCENKIMELYWMDLKLINEDLLSLPVDKKVIYLLKKQFYKL